MLHLIPRYDLFKMAAPYILYNFGKGVGGARSVSGPGLVTQPAVPWGRGSDVIACCLLTGWRAHGVVWSGGRGSDDVTVSTVARKGLRMRGMTSRDRGLTGY